MSTDPADAARTYQDDAGHLLDATHKAKQAAELHLASYLAVGHDPAYANALAESRMLRQLHDEMVRARAEYDAAYEIWATHLRAAWPAPDAEPRRIS